MANLIWYLGAKSSQDDSYNSQQTTDFCESKNFACCRRANLCGPSVLVRAGINERDTQNELWTVLQAREFGLTFATLRFTFSTNTIHKCTTDITKTSTRCSLWTAMILILNTITVDKYVFTVLVITDIHQSSPVYCTWDIFIVKVFQWANPKRQFWNFLYPLNLPFRFTSWVNRARKREKTTAIRLTSPLWLASVRAQYLSVLFLMVLSICRHPPVKVCFP